MAGITNDFAKGEKTAYGRFFHLHRRPSHKQQSKNVRTNIYVDGYNLFYGCLKHSRHKWLDLRQLLFNRIVREQTPAATLNRIKYYTSDTKSKVATRGEQSRHAQERYHRALEAYTDELDIIKGFYSLTRANLLAYEEPPDKTNRRQVWRLEEKQTDVNIALDSYRDAARGHVDQVVFVSNDSDLEPALKAIQHDFGDRVKIGVILPRSDPKRPLSRSLMKQSHWTRRYIRNEELGESHLPRVIVRNRSKDIVKPDYW